MVDKRTYPTVADLLEQNCQEMFQNYKKLYANNEIGLASWSKEKISEKAIVDMDTSMYRYSNEIKKMQKLHSNILNVWYEVDSQEYTRSNLQEENERRLPHDIDAALTEAGYEWRIGKTYIGSNTLGSVDIAPLLVERENCWLQITIGFGLIFSKGEQAH